MLNTLRKNTKKIIWVMIVLFCSWGAFSVSTQFRDKGQIAGRVFGSAVSYQEFNKIRKATEIFTLTGERDKDPGILHQLTWQNIIFAREAKRRWIQVSDEEVSNQVQKLLDAQKVPLNPPEIYEHWVRSISGAAPREFEEMVREMIRIQKLLKTVNTEEVKEPVPAEAKKSFFLEKRKLELEVLRFPNLETAKTFHQMMLKNQAWREQINSKAGPALETPGTQSLRDMMMNYTLSEADAAAVYELEPQSISAPLMGGSSAFIFRVLSKTPVPVSDYDVPGAASKYRDELIERQRKDHFMSWHMQLIQHAHFEDLMPEAAAPLRTVTGKDFQGPK